MTHVGSASLRNRVVIYIDDAVKVARDNLYNVVKLLEIILAVRDESREGERGKVTDGGFLRRRVLYDFGAQVGRLDGAQVLLIRFAYG
jgi:hypothetical protein